MMFISLLQQAFFSNICFKFCLETDGSFCALSVCLALMIDWSKHQVLVCSGRKIQGC